MSLANLLQKEQGGAKAGRPTGLAGILSTAVDYPEKTRQAQREAEAAQFESDAANSFGAIVKGTMKEAGTRLLNIIPNAIKGTKAIYDQSATDMKDAIVQGAEEYGRREPLSLAKAGGRVTGDFANAVFAPLSAAIGSILTATGGQEIIDNTGQLIADKSGITDWEAFQKFAVSHPNAGKDFNRLLTLATLGEAGRGKVNVETIPARLVEQAKTVAREVVNTNSKVIGAKAVATAQAQGLRKLLIEQEGPAVRRVPVGKPAGPRSIYDEVYAREQGYEGYTPEGMLPEIQMGPKSRSVGPSIQMNAPKTRLPGGMRYEAMPEAQPIRSPMQVDEVLGFKKKIPQPVTSSPEIGTVEATPIVGTGGSKTRGLSLGVEAKAVEAKLVSNLGSLPEYNVVNMADQAAKATDLVMKDYDYAKRIATGKEVPPADLLPESVFVAIENAAIKAGDVMTLKELATGQLTTEATTMGQRIRTLAERNPESPVTAIKEVVEARRQGKKIKDVPTAKRETVTELKKELAKTRPTKQNWNDFIKSIQC